MAEILVIDDDISFCDFLTKRIAHLGYESDFAHTIEEGLKKNLAKSYDVIFLDVSLPDGDGLDALGRFQGAKSSPEIIIMTGNGDPDGAEFAMRNGVWDYLEKPVTSEKIVSNLQRALNYRKEKRDKKASNKVKRERIVGIDPAMNACLDFLAQASGTEASVLITGETGTGKELFASAIHANSSRVQNDFVVLDCAALPETLVESMLFGHEKGAFTGAEKPQEGLIKLAHRGTLFLDEVGELSLAVQRKFLRVLHERRFRPIGGTREIESQFRLIAATNRDLDAMARKGEFREDLLYRIKTLCVELPPLRKRPKDIGEIALYHMRRLCHRYGIESKAFSPEFLETLARYSWPGNVRELVNTIENAIAVAGEESVLFPTHLPVRIRVEVARASVSREKVIVKGNGPNSTGPAISGNLKEVRAAAIEEVEETYLKELISHVKGNVHEACRIAGLSRSRLYTLLKKYNVPTMMLQKDQGCF